MTKTIALDPNIIEFYVSCSNCARLLIYIEDNCSQSLQIARDNKGILLRSFRDLLQKRGSTSNKMLDFIFLENLLSNWSKWTIEVTSSSSENLHNQMKEWDCIVESVEYQLLVINVSVDVFAVVVPTEQEYVAKKSDLQQRIIIYDPTKLSNFINILSGIEKSGYRVIDAHSAKAHLDHSLHADRFEERTKEWVTQKYNNHYPEAKIKYRPPYLKQLNKPELDVIAWDHTTEPHRVLICQCKLRMPDNESDQINEAEVQQLLESFNSVKQYEQQKADNEGYNVKVFAMLVTNAQGISPSAKQKLASFKGELWRARLSNNWMLQYNWDLLSCDKL